MYSSMLEGKTVSQAVQKTKEKFIPSFAVGTMFWPVVNIFNFMYIPAHSRVLYVGVAGIAWNTFLSWQNSSKIAAE